MDSALRRIFDDSGDAVVVATIAALPPGVTAQDYAMKVFNENGIGERSRNNGLLILIAQSGQLRIATGLGLEQVITDALRRTDRPADGRLLRETGLRRRTALGHRNDRRAAPRDSALSVATVPFPAPVSGTEWVIDAHGCDPAALRDVARLTALFARLITELSLTPVADPLWHAFAPPGGITGFLMLAESHLACHTFPEFGSICLNVFCCRPRPDWDARRIVADVLGATATDVRRVERNFGSIGSPDLARTTGS